MAETILVPPLDASSGAEAAVDIVVETFVAPKVLSTVTEAMLLNAQDERGSEGGDARRGAARLHEDEDQWGLSEPTVLPAAPVTAPASGLRGAANLATTDVVLPAPVAPPAVPVFSAATGASTESTCSAAGVSPNPAFAGVTAGAFAPSRTPPQFSIDNGFANPAPRLGRGSAESRLVPQKGLVATDASAKSGNPSPLGLGKTAHSATTTTAAVNLSGFCLDGKPVSDASGTAAPVPAATGAIVANEETRERTKEDQDQGKGDDSRGTYQVPASSLVSEGAAELGAPHAADHASTAVEETAVKTQSAPRVLTRYT